jgi:hypothetical protein
MDPGRRTKHRKRTHDIHRHRQQSHIHSEQKRSCDGLWYVNSPILVPNDEQEDKNQPTIHRISTPILADDASVQFTESSNTDNDSQCSIDPIPLFSTQWNKPNTPNITSIAAPASTEPKPAAPSRPGYHTTTWTSQAPQAIKHMELWHQRMGHPSPWTLRNTTKVVDGLPQFPNADSLFHCPFCDIAKMTNCPFCDIAKMTKSSSNKQSTRDSFLPGTAFHMDIGFIRGPKNLKEIMGNSYVTPQATSQLSHDGYSAYLSIINAASRFIFCFPLKSKSPPIDLIDKFFSKHSCAASRTISTNPNSLLRKSTSFKRVCEKYGYHQAAHELLDSPLHELQSMGLEQPRFYICTDNGNKLDGSEAFRQVVDKHKYTLKTTAPDSSGQNGLVEQPHRTLKEKIRCLLYTAGLALNSGAMPYSTQSGYTIGPTITPLRKHHTKHGLAVYHASTSFSRSAPR